MTGDQAGALTGREKLVRTALAFFAEHGIGDTSLRGIAAGIGTSHRMLIYHFGDREGLLRAVVEQLEENERETLSTILDDETTDGRVLAWRYWTHVCDTADLYGPLFFELASHAMRSADLEAPLRRGNTEMWIDALTSMWQRDGGLPAAVAQVQARLNLGVARGLVHQLLLSGDRPAVDAAMARFDWLVFRSPHPLHEVQALLAGAGV